MNDLRDLVLAAELTDDPAAAPMRLLSTRPPTEERVRRPKERVRRPEERVRRLEERGPPGATS